MNRKIRKAYKRKFTNAYFSFKTQDACVNWIFIQIRYTHMFAVLTWGHALEKQNKTELEMCRFTGTSLVKFRKEPKSVMPNY